MTLGKDRTASEEQPPFEKGCRAMETIPRGASSRIRTDRLPGWLCLILLVASVQAAELKVTGGDLEWKVENDYFIVDLSRNTDTGFSGQIKSIYLKDGIDLLISRGGENHTLHLSPNAAKDAEWRGINRWDPPQAWNVEKDTRIFRLHREGPMPGVPELTAGCTYEIRAESRAILVEESLSVKEGTDVSLLRLDEWSVEPGPGNPFTHIAWIEGEKVKMEPRSRGQILPIDTPWVAFYSAARGFGVASLSAGWPAAGELTIQTANPSLRFAGEPHYYYRALIFPPGEFSADGSAPLIPLKAGTGVTFRYYLLFFRGDPSEDQDAVFRRVREFAARLRR